jgi:hypothetical protein
MMDLLENIREADKTESGLAIAIYGFPKTGKTYFVRNIDWDNSLLLDFDTDGSDTLINNGYRPQILSFAILNVKRIKDVLSEKFSKKSVEENWSLICHSLMSKKPEEGDICKEAHLLKISMIGNKHIPFFWTTGTIMKSDSRILVMDSLIPSLQSSRDHRYKNIVIDNISVIRQLMIDSAIHWKGGKSPTKEEYMHINKALKIFQMDSLNIRHIGTNIIAIAWAYNYEKIIGYTEGGEAKAINEIKPDVGGGWADVFLGSFSMVFQTGLAERINKKGEEVTTYYVITTGDGVGSRNATLIDDSCYYKKGSKFLKPDLNLILNSINTKNKEETMEAL